MLRTLRLSLCLTTQAPCCHSLCLSCFILLLPTFATVFRTGLRWRPCATFTSLSVADPGCLSGILGQKDPGSASKNLIIFYPKNCFQALGNMIWDVHPGSGSSFFYPSRIPKPKGQKVTGSQILDPDPQHYSRYPIFSSKHSVMPTTWAFACWIFWLMDGFLQNWFDFWLFFDSWTFSG